MNKFLLKILAFLCPESLFDEIEGDLLEKFYRDVTLLGTTKAKWRLCWNTITFFRPAIILRRRPLKVNRAGLMVNYIQFGFRHLARHRMNSFIHVFGLTFGISACILLTLFIYHHLNFDSYHPHAERTYRVNSIWHESGKEFNMYATPVSLAPMLKSEVPGIAYVTRVLPQFSSVIQIDGVSNFKQDHILIVDPEYLDIFKIEIVAGSGRTAMKTPYNAILSESTARKFFGNDLAVGRTFRYRNQFDVSVAGIMRDAPSNTSLPANMLLSFVDDDKFLDNGDAWFFGDFAWTKLQSSTFVVLDAHTSQANIQSQLTLISNKHINASEKLDKTIRGEFALQRLVDIHLDAGRFGAGPWVKALNPLHLWMLGIIGVIILTLACINFINLSVAQAIIRFKEVSIRKVIGARRSQLIAQFLTEACIITLTSGILSIVVAKLLLRPINLLLNQSIEFDVLQSPLVILSFLIVLLFLGAIAGLYPSTVIARFKPFDFLKKNDTTSWLRQGLVASQFAVSVTLAISVLLVARQVEFIHAKDLGITKENILQVPIGDNTSGDAFKSEVLRIIGVRGVSLSRSAPISDDHWWNTISKNETSERQSVCAIYGDANFFEVYGLKLISGKVLPADLPADTLISKVVVNEQLLLEMNLGSPQEAIGKRFWWGGPTEVIGVVANFNCEPLHYAIPPVLIKQDVTVYTQVNIRLDNLRAGTLDDVATIWKKYFPENVYEPKFLNHQIDMFYQTEDESYVMLLCFAGLAILISCMGLWGIAWFVTLRRVKEVSIRKVMGASVSNILSLFVRRFLRPVLVGGIIALPLSWQVSNAILSNYAYQVDVTWDLFVIPISILIVISILTVSKHSIQAALTNPADNLKSDAQ